MSAGYSGTPLVKKLGIKPADRAVWLDAPEHFEELLGEHGADVKASLRGGADVVVCFVTERRVLAKRVETLKRAIAPDGMVWIGWPKKSSGVQTDITEDVIRDVVLPTGLVDVKVCAIDETWSGLKLVVRRELR